jgi:hypothetical protein
VLGTASHAKEVQASFVTQTVNYEAHFRSLKDAKLILPSPNASHWFRVSYLGIDWDKTPQSPN